MNSFAIVEKFNIAINLLVSLLFRLEDWFAVYQLLLQYAVKGLHARIVVTVAFSAHAYNHLLRC